ncbi:hypothetical protein ACOMHN_033215 [Nucella lapillus]
MFVAVQCVAFLLTVLMCWSCLPSSSSLRVSGDSVRASETRLSGAFFRNPQKGTDPFFPRDFKPVKKQAAFKPPHINPFNNATLCPTDIVVKILPKDFFPESLTEARCRCQRCRGFSGLQCRPVYAEIPVLHLDRSQEVPFYELNTLSVVKSCACVNPDEITSGAGVSGL